MPEDKQHALLSPSAAHRWMSCTASIRATTGISSPTSIYAEEGTRAHARAEYLLKKSLGFELDEAEPAADDKEMEEAVDEYVLFVLEKGGTDGKYFIEQRFPLSSEYAPSGTCFGTTDCAVIRGDTLIICDLKYGMMKVEAEMNPQLLIYALATYEALKKDYAIKDVKMCIFQPRVYNVDEFTILVADLLEWGETVLKPKAYEAAEGTGYFESGSWCRFCPIASTCRTRAEKQMEMAQYDFMDANELSPDEVAEILAKLPDFEAWMTDIREWALSFLISGGKIPGFKVVEGRSTRAITDQDKAAETLEAEGFYPYEKKFMTITALEKLVGRRKFNELLSPYITRKPGKPTIASDEDKRMPIDKRMDAALEFASEEA